jgi:hypothetical protein
VHIVGVSGLSYSIKTLSQDEIFKRDLVMNKKTLTSLVTALLLLTAVFTGNSASAKRWHKAHQKGVKIAKHFSPHRAAKLRKWQKSEIARKKSKRYFSGKKMPHPHKNS